jgi:hypothetical protein
LRSEYAQLKNSVFFRVFFLGQTGCRFGQTCAGFPAIFARAFISPSSVTLYLSSSALLQRGGRVPSRRLLPTYPQYPQERGPGAKDLFRGQLEDSSMTFRPNEAAIDQIVASCNGDVHGALKALLLVNEQLEAELQ